MLNHATAGISSDQMRMHVCWGNYEGPPTHDIELDRIVDIVMRARSNYVSFEALIPGMRMNGSSGPRPGFRQIRFSFPALSTPVRTTSNTRAWWRSVFTAWSA